MTPSRQLQNWNEEGLAWRVATALAENARKEDWPSIMGSLRAQGYHFSESALRQHLQKLKRKDGAAAPANAGSAKKKAATPRGKKRTKAAMASDDDDEEENDDDALGTPSKKVARGKKVVPAAPLDVDEDEMKLVKNEKYLTDTDNEAV